MPATWWELYYREIVLVATPAQIPESGSSCKDHRLSNLQQLVNSGFCNVPCLMNHHHWLSPEIYSFSPVAIDLVNVEKFTAWAQKDSERHSTWRAKHPSEEKKLREYIISGQVGKEEEEEEKGGTCESFLQEWVCKVLQNRRNCSTWSHTLDKLAPIVSASKARKDLEVLAKPLIENGWFKLGGKREPLQLLQTFCNDRHKIVAHEKIWSDPEEDEEDTERRDLGELWFTMLSMESVPQLQVP